MSASKKKINSMFTSEQLRTLVKSSQSSQRADIYASILKQDFIRFEEDLYKIDHKYQLLEVYPKTRINNILITAISDLLYTSEQHLNDDQLLILRSKEYSGYSKLSNPSNIKSILPLIDERLFNSSIDLVGKKNEIHFRNGFFDVQTGKFKKRKTPTLYYIDRDYKKSSTQERQFMLDVFSKIYPIEEEREYIFNTLSSAFSGDAKCDRTSLFLIGKSSAGKSLLMQSLRSAFSNTYVKEFGSDTFSKSNSNKNKIFNEFLHSKQIRLCWVNELTGKIDDSLFKSFCEGSVHTCSLYKDGLNEIVHNAKVVLTANDLPNIRIDSGTENRIVSHEHRSFFTDDHTEIDESIYIFKKDKKLLDKINRNVKYQNAIVDIVLKYTKEWFSSGLRDIPKSMADNKNDIVSCNDYVQDFIDKHIDFVEHCSTKPSRIGKTELRDSYLQMFPEQKRSMQQIISMFKDKKWVYKSDMRCDGVKGCFIDVEFKNDVSEALVYSRSPLDIARIKTQQSEIDKLKQIIDDMKSKTPKKISTKPKKISNKPKKISTKPNTHDTPITPDFDSLMCNTLKLF